MAMTQTRRRFLSTLSAVGAAGLVRAPRASAAEAALETTTVRLTKSAAICIAPEYVAEEFLLDIVADRKTGKSAAENLRAA